jgi:urease accessory protein
MQTTQIRRTILASAGLATALVSPLVMAHAGADIAHTHDTSLVASFTSGALHPLTGLDHLAAMLSVGLWSVLGQAASAGSGWRERKLWAAPAAFALTLLAGAMLAMAGMTLPGVEPMIAASLLVLGLLVATRARMAPHWGAALVAGFALFHGVAHGAELGGHAAAALTGMVLSTAALHGLGMGLGLAMRDQTRQTSRWLPRLIGGAVALAGLNLLTPAITAAI